KLRERHNRPRQRVEVAHGLAAEAGERHEAAHLGDHLLRDGEVDRRQAEAAVTIDFGEDAAGSHYHQRPDIGVDTIADQNLAEAGHHWLHQHAIYTDVRRARGNRIAHRAD